MKNFIKSIRKFIVLGVSVILIAASIVGATMAYVTSNSSANNNLTVGSVTSEIDETFEIDGYNNITKEPVVTNTGVNPVWIRARATVSSPVMADGVDIEYNTDDWETRGSDGFWYYNTIVQPGGSTTSLFTEVALNAAGEALLQSDQFEDFEVVVYQETVQSVAYDSAGSAITDASAIWAAYK